MAKTQEQVQKEAKEELKDNNDVGTVVLSTGSGKSKVAIDRIKEGNYKNILITSPRSNLKENWKKELDKWYFTSIDFAFDDKNFTFENIQTCYKWDEDKIKQFDLIIFDEIHTMATEKYGRPLRIRSDFDLPRIGLTATPDIHKEDKKHFYKLYCPIVYEYMDSAKDGIVNKRKYIIYRYDLTNDYTVKVKTKKKEWTEGEKNRYLYINNLFDKSKDTIENFYFNEIKNRVSHINKLKKVRASYKRFFNKIISKDLDYFRKIYWQAMKAKKLPYDLYKMLRNIQKNDYAKFGMKASYYASFAPESIKSEFYKYIWTRNERKNFLWNLSSSADIAVKLKKEILGIMEGNNRNKILLFSELTAQAERLSDYAVHSHNDEETNKQLLHAFDSGKIRELASCNSLTLGLNLIGANYAIMESFNGSPTLLKQKAGRTDRLFVEDIATVIFIIPNGTQTEKWFEQATKKLDMTNSETIYDIKDLKL